MPAPPQIVLLGVSLGPGPEDFTLQPLHYRVPSDNVVMTTVAAAVDGRVFLGGADGHLYELQYDVRGARKVRSRISLLGCCTFERLLP